MGRLLRFGLLPLFVVVLGIGIAFVFLHSAPKAAPWFSAVSAVNGYDALVQAAAEMNGRPPNETADPTAFVNANDHLFELVESALKLPFELPLSTYSLTNSALPELGRFKTVALALRAKGREAEIRGANAEAAAVFTEIIQMGQLVEHGPLIALLSGISIEKIGLDAIEKVASRLSAAQQQNLAEQLETLNKQRLAFAEVTLRERYFARRITGNPVKLLLAWYMGRNVIQTAHKKQERISSDIERVAKTLRLPPNQQ
jgi:hypothetical protein